MIMRARVDDPILGVVLGPVHAPGMRGIEAELKHDHPREAELVAQPLDRPA